MCIRDSGNAAQKFALTVTAPKSTEHGHNSTVPKDDGLFYILRYYYCNNCVCCITTVEHTIISMYNNLIGLHNVNTITYIVHGGAELVQFIKLGNTRTLRTIISHHKVTRMEVT